MKTRCIWLTGLPCSGKTTLAKELEGHYSSSIVLDGDEIRNTPLANKAGFSAEDRKNHILRMGHLAKMFTSTGVTAICSFVSPSEETRQAVRAMFDEGDFIEVHVDAPLSLCIERDVKGMYAKALSGEIANFTGIGSSYDAPTRAELVLDTASMTVDECVKQILDCNPPRSNKKCLFIGRWNGVFHNGHDHIIQSKLEQGKEVLLGVRDVEPDEKNPWTAKQVKEMLEYRFKDDNRVQVIIIPDVESVEYGRGVGYEVNEIKVTKDIAGISGTECRRMISEGTDSWKDFVPAEIVEFFENE
jgi:adenylylsulfate kinase